MQEVDQVQLMRQMSVMQAQLSNLMLRMTPQAVPAPEFPTVTQQLLTGKPYHVTPGANTAQIDPNVLNRLVGPDPQEVDKWHWNRWYDGDRGDKEPVPKWNGQNPAKNLKPWLRDLRIWRQETSVPVYKHGLKLYRSFEANSWMKLAADRIPEEKLYGADAWPLILNELLVHLKPYIDVQLDILIEEAIFSVHRESKEPMTAYVTRKTNKRRELCAALGFTKVECSECKGQSSIVKDFPDEMWSYLLRRGANLSEEQRKLIHQWDSGILSGERLTELLLRLDRTDTIVAQSVASGHEKTAYLISNQRDDGKTGHPVPGAELGSSEAEWTVQDSAYTAVANIMQDSPADSAVEHGSDSESEFDQMAFDDDGSPLVDDSNNLLIPYEPDKTYEEEETIFLCAFAGTYREVRGKLQATRIGRDQKVFTKKPFLKKKPFFKPGSAPRKPRPDRKTLFKDKAGGKNSRGTTNDLLKRTKCFRCGKLGHMSRNCKSPTAPE